MNRYHLFKKLHPELTFPGAYTAWLRQKLREYRALNPDAFYRGGGETGHSLLVDDDAFDAWLAKETT